MLAKLVLLSVRVLEVMFFTGLLLVLCRGFSWIPYV